MTGEGVAAIGAVAIVVITAGLLFTMASVIRTMAVMRRAVEDVHDETVPLLVDVHSGVVHTNQELKRVDSLIDRAESIAGTVDSTSKLASRLFSNPAVKVMALSAGGARALRRLRKAKA
ncbi:MAG: DUF948 domain-containing protein [Actinomycetota bacterium]|nr:DUF948 domain-containing protein [Actinomycetota bacterium]